MIEQRVQTVLSEICNKDIDPNEELVQKLLNEEFTNFHVGYTKKGSCYGTHYAVAFNTKSSDQLSSGNFDNRRIIKEGTSDLGKWIYYSYDIDSGD
jgi:hypothetical protein